MREVEAKTLFQFESPEDDAILGVLGTFQWIAEIFDQKHKEVLATLFGSFPGTADELLAEDPDYIKWYHLMVSFRDFQDRMNANETASFDLDGSTSPPDFQDFETPYNDLIASVETLLQNLKDAKPAVTKYKTALQSVYSGQAEWQNEQTMIVLRDVPSDDQRK
jgi:hypothetical protein